MMKHKYKVFDIVHIQCKLFFKTNFYSRIARISNILKINQFFLIQQYLVTIDDIFHRKLTFNIHGNLHQPHQLLSLHNM